MRSGTFYIKKPLQNVANIWKYTVHITFKGKKDYICLTGGYHGHVQSALEVSPYKWKENGVVQQPKHVHVVDAPDAFRGKFKGNEDYAAQNYAQQVKEVLEKNNGNVAAYIAESLMSCAGILLKI